MGELGTFAMYIPILWWVTYLFKIKSYLLEVYLCFNQTLSMYFMVILITFKK